MNDQLGSVASMSPVKAFFAYPASNPSLAEAIREATRQINIRKQVLVEPWENCKVSGKLVIHEICRHIDESPLFLADVTNINANVMFELGYAIAKDKRIWIVLDTSFSEATKAFDQLRLLTTVGYSGCHNSDDIIKAFIRDQPWTDLHNTLYRQSVAPYLNRNSERHLLYLKSKHENEASISLSKYITARDCRLIVDDPAESSIQSLSWYVGQVSASFGMVCHLNNPNREGARLQAAKYALVAGMTYGLSRPLLMLAEGDFLGPIDYRDMLKHYSSAREAVTSLREWLTPYEEQDRREKELRDKYNQRQALSKRLVELRFGEYVAENEAQELLNYFVPTLAYENALKGAHTIFVGRKGSGKSANFFKLQQQLSQDKRNLVCVIKPVAYEMQGITNLLALYKQSDAKGYATESLWKFLLLTEIARSLFLRLDSLPVGAAGEKEQNFLHFVTKHHDIIKTDFSIRLEKCVAKMLGDVPSPQESSVEKTRLAISESLHTNILSELRSQLSLALGRITRIVILIDNLDKAWDKGEDMDLLAEILLGLMNVCARIQQELKVAPAMGISPVVSVALMLRSDIFARVMGAAREPDKLRFSRLEWRDPQLLRRLIEERFVAGQGGDVDATLLWDDYFCKTVKGRNTRDYFMDTIIMRPRDLIYFISAAVEVSVNRSHDRVEEEDVLEAEKQYSQYALESLFVEGVSSGINLENMLFDFAGLDAILGKDMLVDILSKRMLASEVLKAMDILSEVTFLGVEVERGRFSYSDDPKERKRDLVRAERLAAESGTPVSYKIHRAFHAFLEIHE